MPNDILDSMQKRKIFDALKRVSTSDLQSALLNAALNNKEFPLECEDFTLTCKAHSMTKNEQIKKKHNDTIHSYMDEEIFISFQKLLKEPFNETKWRSSFLLGLAKCLNIKVGTLPLVELAIKEGKVYWRITQNGEVVYDRSRRKNPLMAFNFTSAHTVSMTWEQFRLFKESGKRGGSVAITQDRFIKEFPQQKKVAAGVWEQLVTKGILDSNYRLSSTWHFTSSKSLTLENSKIPYPEISKAFNKILSDRNNVDKIDCISDATLYREPRSIKKWCKTGLIKGFEPNGEHSKVQRWDVGIKGHLDNHGKKRDTLDHDHNPSRSLLSDYINGFSDKNCSPEDIQWLRDARKEEGVHWSCIAIPEKLHDRGLSNGEGKTAQAQKITAPFLDEVREYLDIIESETQKHRPSEEKKLEVNGFSLDRDDPIKALGAFRYMYRCQVKGNHGKVPQLFFHNSTNKPQIDALLHERLERFIRQR